MRKKISLLSFSILMTLTMFFGLNTYIKASAATYPIFNNYEEYEGKTYQIIPDIEHDIIQGKIAFDLTDGHSFPTGYNSYILNFPNDNTLKSAKFWAFNNTTKNWELKETIQGAHFDEISSFYINSVYGNFEAGSDWTYIVTEEESFYTAVAFEYEFMDGIYPVIEGETAFVTNVDVPMSETEIRSHIHAYDNEDGNITNRIQLVEDNYSINKIKLGTWTIKYSVSDTSGNTSFLTVHVLVKDITPPVITGQSNYNQSMTKLLSLDTIKNNLTVIDNYDLELSIILKSDNYSANYNKVGSYQVIFESTDNTGNKGNYTVTINVIDDVKPTISGPTTIVKGQSDILSINDIKAQLTANDNWDGNITDKIQIKTDNYTGKGHLTGNYTIIFSVSDNSGNTTEKTVTIQVKDNIPPVFYVDNYFITVKQSLTLTLQDFIDLLQSTGQIRVTAQTNVRMILNEYEGNENKIGMYSMTFRTSSTDGSEEDISVVVNVVEDTTDGITLNPPLTFWDHIKNIFKWIWELIVKIFKWIF